MGVRKGQWICKKPNCRRYNTEWATECRFCHTNKDFTLIQEGEVND